MNDQCFVPHLQKYVGETVTIFTTSGGASGCGFTGVLLFVNCSYVRLMTRVGTPPANPLSKEICPRPEDNKHKYPYFTVGSVCDIPIEKIASFCHNAI